MAQPGGGLGDREWVSNTGYPLTQALPMQFHNIYLIYSCQVENIWKSKKRFLSVLAPMAGYTDSAFRLMCKKFGADIVMTEMVSADAIAHGKFKVTHMRHPRAVPAGRQEGGDPLLVDSHFHGNDIKVEGKNKNTADLLSFNEKERPIVIQLFGKNPENFQKAAEWISDNLKPDGIDINMGCPAKKVVGSDHGSALLKNPKLAVEIVRAVKSVISCPLSVKTRLGWQNDDEILDFGPKLIQAGVDALIIHGRTYKDGFRNKARWENIYNLKLQTSNFKNKEVSIIGNGDIKSYDDIIQKVNNLDGVAIGRAAVGKPMIFLNNESRIKNNGLKGIILKHSKMAYDTKGEHGIIEFRKHLLAYLRGFSNAKELRVKAVKIETVEDVRKIANQIISN